MSKLRALALFGPLLLMIVGWLVTAARFEVFQWDALLMITGIGLAFAWFPRPLADGLGAYLGYFGRGPRINRQSAGVVVQWMFRSVGWFLLVTPLLPGFDPTG